MSGIDDGDQKGVNQVEGSKTAKPFHEGEDAGGDASPGMNEAPLDRADAVGDAGKKAEMPKTTQREE